MPAPFLVSYILQLVNVTFGHLWHEDRIKPMPETKTLLEERHGTHFVSSTLGLLLKEHGFNKPCSNFLDTEMMCEWKSAFPINHNLNAKRFRNLPIIKSLIGSEKLIAYTCLFFHPWKMRYYLI